MDTIEKKQSAKSDAIKTNEYLFCLRCHRRLKTPAARLRGYGDVCYQKVGNYAKIPLF